MANALAAIVKNTKLSTSGWKEPDLDYVLMIGVNIYMDFKERSDVQFLTVEDLPPAIENYAISYGNAFFGTVKICQHQLQKFPSSPEQAVKKLDQATGASMKIVKSTPTYAKAIIKKSIHTIYLIHIQKMILELPLLMEQ